MTFSRHIRTICLRTILIASILPVVASVSVYAETVSKEKALKAAGNFFGTGNTKAAAPELTIVWDGIQAATKSTVTPPFYVIGKEGGGFVIIAGNDNVTPVLGFSEENVFPVQNMPEHVSMFMEMIAIYCRSFNDRSKEVEDAWKTILTGTSASKVSGEYLGSRTVQWDQSEPFNGKAPLLGTSSGGSGYSGDHGDGERCAAGCVPVALAEILTWHGAPDQGDGSEHTIFRESGKSTEEYGKNTLNTTYDWTEIRKIKSWSDTKNASETILENIAQLLLDCGTLVGAVYGESTGAMATSAVEAFGLHMGYNKAAHFEFPEEYTKQEWSNMLVSEISKRPVLYTGQTEDGGHAFVADGYATYKGEYLFHFNFGWGTYYNGYYYDFSHPDIDGDDFSINQSAMFDFYPSSDGEFRNTLHLKASEHNRKGLYLTQQGIQVKKGSKITVKFGNIDMSNTTFRGKIRICLEDRTGEVKEILYTSSNVNWNNNYYWDDDDIAYGGIDCTVSEETEFGDRIALWYSIDDSGTDFERIRYPKDGSITGVFPCYSAAFIDSRSSYSKGDKFTLALVNNAYPYNSTYYSTEWEFTSPDGTVSSYDTSDESVTLDKSGNWTIRAIVSDLKNWNDGTYETITTTITVN